MSHLSLNFAVHTYLPLTVLNLSLAFWQYGIDAGLKRLLRGIRHCEESNPTLKHE